MVPLLVAAALAAPCLAPPAVAVLDRAVSADGAGWLLAGDATQVCWWVVDDVGDARVAARWAGDVRPIALAALGDGRAVLALEEPGGWKLVVRDGTGQVTLGWRPPVRPRGMAAHPDLPLLAVWGADGDANDAWLLDLGTGETFGPLRLPGAKPALHFRPGDPRLWLGPAPAAVRGVARRP